MIKTLRLFKKKIVNEMNPTVRRWNSPCADSSVGDEALSLVDLELLLNFDFDFILRIIRRIRRRNVVTSHRFVKRHLDVLLSERNLI